MAAKADLVGIKFSRLVVVRENGAKWDCVCDCGNYKTLSTGALRSGNTKSCGCLHKERVSNKFRKHFLKNTPEYTSWQLMKDRCYNKNNKTFEYYGGKGITVCDRWINNPQAFFDDMGKKPSKNHTIDRIDCNGNYSKENCRWATKSEQSRNRTDSKMLTIDGITKHLADWADYYNIQYKQVYKRVWRGMNPIQALTTPLREK